MQSPVLRVLVVCSRFRVQGVGGRSHGIGFWPLRRGTYGFTASVVKHSLHVYADMYVYNVYIYRVCMCVYIHICMHMYIHTYVRRTCIHAHMHMYVDIVHMHIHIGHI